MLSDATNKTIKETIRKSVTVTLSTPTLTFSYETSNELGRGAHAVVYHGHNTKTSEPLAIKHYDIKKSKYSIETVERERAAMRALSDVWSPYLMTIVDVISPPFSTECHVVMQRVPAMTLGFFLTHNRASHSEIRRIMRQVAQGVELMHSCRLAHRDIKPSNISYDPVEQRAVIIDFGFAIHTLRDEIPLNETELFIGTPLYMPPETILQFANMPFKHDIYSLGCVLYALYAQHDIYHDVNDFLELRQRFIKQQFCGAHNDMSDAMAALFTTMTQPRFRERPSAKQVVAMFGPCSPDTSPSVSMSSSASSISDSS